MLQDRRASGQEEERVQRHVSSHIPEVQVRAPEGHGHPAEEPRPRQDEKARETHQTLGEGGQVLGCFPAALWEMLRLQEGVLYPYQEVQDAAQTDAAQMSADY